MAAFYRGIILTKSEGRGPDQLDKWIFTIWHHFPFQECYRCGTKLEMFFIEEENFTKAVSFSSRAKKQNLGIRNIKGPM